MEEREFKYNVEVFLTPKIGNNSFKKIILKGEGCDEKTAEHLASVLENIKDAVDAKLNFTIETK